jgi:hypothetical protein
VIIRLRGLDARRVEGAAARMLELDGRGEPVEVVAEDQEGRAKRPAQPTF